MLLVTILAPLAAMLVQMAISRTREYSADRAGAMIAASRCGSPGRCSGSSSWRGVVNEPAERNPPPAHLFINNPLRMGGIDSLFRTHPPTADRVRRLHELAGAADPGGAWALGVKPPGFRWQAVPAPSEIKSCAEIPFRRSRRPGHGGGREPGQVA